jgi:hypothetical protein
MSQRRQIIIIAAVFATAIAAALAAMPKAEPIICWFPKSL